jgi:BASS family bile acid:Na+ symporter
MLLILLKSSIATLIFAVGMTATADDITYLWRRPILLLKSIVAMYVVMPAIAVLMARTLNLPHGTGLALVVLAICAGAPLLPKKLIKFGGDPAYVFSLIVTTSLLAIVTVPASLHLLDRVITFDTTAVTPSQVARIILKTFLLPLGLGMLTHLATPRWAERIGDPLMKIGGAAMGLCALVVLVARFRVVFTVGLPSLIGFAVFTLAALAAGHLLGGPTFSTRKSLAIACASRHIGLALLIAANARGPRVLALVAAYLLASAAVLIPYLQWIRKRRG